jgi:Secretion system C-terminal sorting domain
LQLSIDPSKIKSITVFDFMGRQLKTIKANIGLQNVDVSNFSTGKYLVQMITTDGQGYNIPFIKAE